MTVRLSNFSLVAAAALTLCVLITDVFASDTVGWSSVGQGTNAPVRVLATFDDGSGPALFAGGQFTTAGGLTVNGIAKWDGEAWSPLSSNGGIGVDGWVYALEVYDDGSGPALYVAGAFTFAGDLEVNGIAKWDGENWHALSGPAGTGISSGAINALEVYDDGFGPALYAGGSFINAGGVVCNHIAKWDGFGWSALIGPNGTGVNSWVLALQTFNDGSGPSLFAGGRFPTAGGIAVNRIAKWNGAQWSPLAGPNGTGFICTCSVRSLAVYDDGSGPALFVGGTFPATQGVTYNRIAKWDGTDWYSLLSGGSIGVSNRVDALTTFVSPITAQTRLVAGGDFISAGGQTVNRVASWDGVGWQSFDGPNGIGVDSWVRTLEVFDDGSGPALYAGGEFQLAGGEIATGIAKWGVIPPAALVAVPGDFDTIQEAIDDTPGNFRRTILVGPGTYQGPVDFRGKDITVRGSGSEFTIIQGTGGETSSVILFSGGEPASASLEDVRVQGGLTGSPRPDAPQFLVGGGLLAFESNAAVRDCVFEGNFASFGGGIYAFESNLTIESCSILNNEAGADGGGLLAFGGQVVVVNSIVEGNHSQARGGGMHFVGGMPTVCGTQILHNSSTNNAGGLSWVPGSSPIALLTIEDSTIANNSAGISQGGIGTLPIGGDSQFLLSNSHVCGNSPLPNISGPWTDQGDNTVCCQADVTGDGQINLADLNTVLANFGQQTSAGDTNNDGVVDLADLNAVLAAFGTTCE